MEAWRCARQSSPLPPCERRGWAPTGLRGDSGSAASPRGPPQEWHDPWRVLPRPCGGCEDGRVSLQGFESVPELHSERLLLRPLGPPDAEGVFRIFSDPEVTRLTDADTMTHAQEASV